jgi:hypothetical protein
VDADRALAITAGAAAISAILTLLFLLEARASRIASRDTATVLARLGFSEDRQAYDFLYLENLGPAVARDVHMAVAYVDEAGEVLAQSGPISAAVLGPGPNDRAAFLPAMLLEADRSGSLPDLEELAARNLTLRIDLDWLDDRLWFPVWFRSRRHHVRTVVDLRAYAKSNLKALRVVDATLLSAAHEAQRKAERWRFEDTARARMKDGPLPPDVQARVEADRLARAAAIWRARGRYWVGRLSRRLRRR